MRAKPKPWRIAMRCSFSGCTKDFIATTTIGAIRRDWMTRLDRCEHCDGLVVWTLMKAKAM